MTCNRVTPLSELFRYRRAPDSKSRLPAAALRSCLLGVHASHEYFLLRVAGLVAVASLPTASPFKKHRAKETSIPPFWVLPRLLARPKTAAALGVHRKGGEGVHLGGSRAAGPCGRRSDGLGQQPGALVRVRHSVLSSSRRGLCPQMTLRSAESSDGADRAGAEWEAGGAAAEPAERERLDSALRELRCAGWYWGSMSVAEAKERLQETSEGTFLEYRYRV
ncbi:suppressor of cytokine signaling 2 [Crotalus adamanteus]|uniref:Suppressor of cytokine signaling 2 n=1 Tax=Crotalus adamanteus TaxID=8729 RepID=A0AAW1BCI9_CROAD